MKRTSNEFKSTLRYFKTTIHRTSREKLLSKLQENNNLNFWNENLVDWTVKVLTPRNTLMVNQTILRSLRFSATDMHEFSKTPAVGLVRPQLALEILTRTVNFLYWKSLILQLVRKKQSLLQMGFMHIFKLQRACF